MRNVFPRPMGFLALSLLVTLLSPALRAEEATTPTTKSVTANEIWQKLTDEATHDESGDPLSLQPGCEPAHLAAQGTPVGTAILIHGYSACPQQYQELGGMLAAAGYEVYMPLSPGHGRVLDDKGKEDLRGMPGRYDSDRYIHFAQELNELAEASSGLRLIAGLSGGGGIATYAMNSAKVPYDRVVLMAPWFHVHVNFIENIPLAIERILPLDFGALVPWGASCTIERQHGRVGYCNTLVANLAGAENFGELTLFDLKATTSSVQVVAVENDTAVSVPAILDGVSKMGLSKNQVCVMPNGIPHSFFSRFDNVSDHPVWIPAFESAFVNYAVHGTAFPQGQPSQIIPGFVRCDVPLPSAP